MRFDVVTLAAILAVASFSVSARAEEKPTLRKATFSTHTNDNDKDHDTTITVEVMSSDGSMKIAHANEVEGSSDDSKQYKDHSDHGPTTLETDAEDVAKSACTGYKVRFCMTPHGGREHDTWELNAEVKLVFSDKSNLVASISSIKLDQDHRCTAFAQK
jgi:hypothetical protein